MRDTLIAVSIPTISVVLAGVWVVIVVEICWIVTMLVVCLVLSAWLLVVKLDNCALKEFIFDCSAADIADKESLNASRLSISS